MRLRVSGVSFGSTETSVVQALKARDWNDILPLEHKYHHTMIRKY